VLVFTEFLPAQEMLMRFLTERGFEVVCLNGSLGLEERKRVQEAFAQDARILISTDAGGEGLNLLFCHVVINYDIPWNPVRLEQRIGRVDRIGQTHTARAINFVFEDSVEHRVREVLEEKLAVLGSTSLFPFRLSSTSADHLVTVSGRLDVLRHSLDQDLIMLRTESLPAAKGGGGS